MLSASPPDPLPQHATLVGTGPHVDATWQVLLVAWRAIYDGREGAQRNFIELLIAASTVGDDIGHGLGVIALGKARKYGISEDANVRQHVCEAAFDALVLKMADGTWLAGQARAFYEETVADVPQERHAGQLSYRFTLRLGDFAHKAAVRLGRMNDRRLNRRDDDAPDPLTLQAQTIEPTPPEAALTSERLAQARNLLEAAGSTLRERDAAFVWLKLAQASPGVATPVPPEVAAYVPNGVPMRRAFAAIAASRDKIDDVDVAALLGFDGTARQAMDRLSQAKSRAWGRLRKALEELGTSRRDLN
jgi:hypothetical protein